MIKKVKFIVLFSFLLNYSFAQQRITIKAVESNRMVTHQGIEFSGNVVEKNNEVFMFPKWNNYSEIFIGDKVFLLSNVNFNFIDNSIYSRVSRDKFFQYKKNMIDAISINNHLFKKVGDSLYEVLLEKNNYLFLKKYEIEYQSPTADRMGVVRGGGRTLVKNKYLVITNDKLISITLKKKSIIGLFNIDKDIVDKFVKTEKLSYKDENDVAKIFEFLLANSEDLI